MMIDSLVGDILNYYALVRGSKLGSVILNKMKHEKNISLKTSCQQISFKETLRLNKFTNEKDPLKISHSKALLNYGFRPT